MENEDYKIITLHDNKLKVYRDCRIVNNTRYFRELKPGISRNGYKCIVLSSNDKRKYYTIHRIIAYTFLGLDIDNPKEIIDHINGNKKDNTFMNLRVTTLQGNQFNRKNTKGYTWSEKKKRYRSVIGLNKKNINLGSYKTEACARYAYLVAKNHYHQF